MRSRDTFRASATLTLGSEAASHNLSEMSKCNRAAKRTDRNTRSGSSRSVLRGVNGVSTMPFCKSFNPFPVMSSISPVDVFQCMFVFCWDLVRMEVMSKSAMYV